VSNGCQNILGVKWVQKYSRGKIGVKNISCQMAVKII